MTVSTDGPTRGAFEQADDTRWRSSPTRALAIRAMVVASPVIGAFVVLYLVAGVLIRPDGVFGLLAWFAQGLMVGTAVSMTIERLARGLLPLATLFEMSLIFPDQAPSRFSVALRAGTIRKLQQQGPAADASFLGEDASEAATRAIEYVAALGRHDRLTRGHTERVRAYADLIGAELGLPDEERAKLTWGVMLHDIGKMAVPPEILNKQSKLTEEEWQILKEHPAAGGRMLTPLRDWLGSWSLAASEHHERWDGKGYPNGLAGADISLAGRITAVADAYDVITSKRSYKEPMTPAAARRELVVCSGTQFDPDIVRAFLNVSLGRRWSAGLVATVSHLPIGNLGTAPAAVTIGAVATAGSVAVGVVPPEIVEELAFEAPPPEVVEEAPVPVETTTTTIVVTSAPEGTPRLEEVTVEIGDSTPIEESTTTSASTTLPTTAAPTTTTTTTATTTTTPPTTAAPTTAAPTTAPPTTAAPTTAPPTTAAPTTTTTAAPTTTTAPGLVYYLENPGGDGSDTNAQLWKQLALDPPVDTVQYNFDQNYDGLPGLRLQPTGSGWSEGDTRRLQRYFLDAENQTLTGAVTLRVWAASATDGVPVTIRASVSECSWLGACGAPIGAEDTATTSRGVNVGFEELTFDLGGVDEPIDDNRYVVIRLITEGSETAHIAFDSTLHPSQARLTVS
ncbi:MAG: HD-GYP domain-containing protein [Actinomycetota bacterium]